MTLFSPPITGKTVSLTFNGGFMILKYIRIACIFFIMVIFYYGCSSSVAPSEEHFKAAGLYVVAAQDTIVRYEAGVVNGLIKVNVGLNTKPLSLLFVKDDGTLGLPSGEEYSLDWQVADTTIARVVAEEDIVNYILRVKGVRIGQTSLAIILKHHDHKDFESPAIPVHVQEVVILPKN